MYADLQNNIVRCYLAPEELKGGRKVIHQITDAIRVHDKLLLILSKDSINSDWVATEIKRARRNEGEQKKQMLFPIRLMNYEELKKWELFDSDTGTNLAEEIRSYFIPDFSDWKNHDSYKKALDRLLRDLKAENPKTQE